MSKELILYPIMILLFKRLRIVGVSDVSVLPSLSMVVCEILLILKASPFVLMW